MLVIISKSDDPYFNIAAEEYLFKGKNEEICLLYINRPSVIAGKHQNIYEEVNIEHLIERKIPVIRRISGGGTVYHDAGNLNYTFIRNRPEGRQVDFSREVKPVIAYLNEKGVETAIGSKHEIRSGGLKFSGNAQHVFRNRVLHHGTILFSSRLDELGEALKKGEGIYRSRAVQSNRTSVGNLAGRIEGIDDTLRLAYSLRDFMLDYEANSTVSHFGNEETNDIGILAETKYRTWEWTFGYGPDYSFENRFPVSGREVTVKIETKRGVISRCEIGNHDKLSAIGPALAGTRHYPDDLRERIKLAGVSLEQKELMGFFR